MKSKILIVLAFLCISNAWADMFCPNNFNSINIGDSLDAVIAACGKPDSRTKSTQKAAQPQEWVYYVQNDPSMPGTMRTTVAFDANGKVINISVNGSGLSQTQICANGQIELGDTQETIQAACGKPAYINQTSIQGIGPQETEITELIYNTTPPVTLVFENGKLTQRK